MYFGGPVVLNDSLDDVDLLILVLVHLVTQLFELLHGIFKSCHVFQLVLVYQRGVRLYLRLELIRVMLHKSL